MLPGQKRKTLQNPRSTAIFLGTFPRLLPTNALRAGLEGLSRRGLAKVAAPFGERVQCDERSGEPRPLSIDREGKFSLTAKPYCDSLKLEIEVSPEIAGRIAALLAAL
jgi:hypothetical protein